MTKLSLATLAVIAIAPFGTQAIAKTCASAAVIARGEQSRYEWLAKTKARANWRRRVRATAGLGPDYANWARAEATEERCMIGPSGTLCIFTGTPCLP